MITALITVAVIQTVTLIYLYVSVVTLGDSYRDFRLSTLDRLSAVADALANRLAKLEVASAKTDVAVIDIVQQQHGLDASLLGCLTQLAKIAKGA